MGKQLDFIKNIFRKDLQTLVFFVTSRCNSKCLGCFNWKNLNKSTDLTLSEIEKISKKLPEFKHVLFSGGEPLLRNDLPEICRIFKKNNHIESVGIPSNGLMPKKYEDIVKKILDKNPQLEVGVHFSLDGLAKTHDKLRGIKGNFNNLVQSAKRINKLREQYPRLSISINTVISNQNHQELGKLIKYVKTLKVDSHTFDLLRGALKPGIGLNLPDRAEINKINKLRLATRSYYLKGKNIWQRFFSMSKENYLIHTQREILNGKKRPFDCLAGKVIAVITSDGKLGLCELLAPIGSLRKNNYDFDKLFNCADALNQRKNINSHQCDCTHYCFLSAAIDHSPLTVFFRMPFNYLFNNAKK